MDGEQWESQGLITFGQKYDFREIIKLQRSHLCKSQGLDVLNDQT